MKADRHKTPSFPLRISPELRALLQESAKKNQRSLNAEISIRLEETYNSELVSLENIRAIIREELKDK